MSGIHLAKASINQLYFCILDAKYCVRDRVRHEHAAGRSGGASDRTRRETKCHPGAVGDAARRPHAVL